MDPRHALSTLLRQLFSSDQLRAFVRSCPEGLQISHDLPGPTTSLAQVADWVVVEFARRGRVSEEFFQRLMVERPGRAEDVGQVWMLWQTSPPPANASGTSTTPLHDAATTFMQSFAGESGRQLAAAIVTGLVDNNDRAPSR